MEYLTFLETKNGKTRKIQITPTIRTILDSLPRFHPWVFTNSKTEKPYKSVRKVFERALVRAGITTGDVTFHTLRHTALSRMIAGGIDDYTVMAISGHSSTRISSDTRTRPTSGRRTPSRRSGRPWSQNGHNGRRRPRTS